MTPELSRRVAKIMNTEVIYKLTATQHIAFTKAVGSAIKFSDLDSKYQTLIETAEKSKSKKS